MFKAISTIILVAGLLNAALTVYAASSEDPLRPPGYKIAGSKKTVGKQPKTWFVNEILHSEGRRLAIVNNETVKKGDLVNGARVVDITAEQVTLEYKGRTINSRLNLVAVKKLKNK